MSLQMAAVVTLIKSLNLLLGGWITLYAYRAYSRTNSTALLALFVGFGIITVGAFIAGLVDQLLGWGANRSLVIEGLFTMGGFATILYSLYM